MKIYIPSMARAHLQYTMASISGTPMGDAAVIVVPKPELREYLARWPAANVVACPWVGSGNTRQWIFERHEKTSDDPVLLMLDDDLTFTKRRTDDPTRFIGMNAKEHAVMLSKVEKLLLTYAHGGILAREGGNRVTDPVVYNTRTMRVIGYNVPMVRAAIGKKKLFGEVPVQDDFHATLTLLRRGLMNAVLASYVNNQRGSGTVGGASVYRTMAVHNASVEKLRSLHPEFVRVVEKQTKTAWGGQTRNDVIVSWKKAYAEGVANNARR